MAESVIAAFFGFNTIKGWSGITSSSNTDGKDDADYYTTTDRKAFTISDIVEVRNQSIRSFSIWTGCSPA